MIVEPTTGIVYKRPLMIGPNIVRMPNCNRDGPTVIGITQLQLGLTQLERNHSELKLGYTQQKALQMETGLLYCSQLLEEKYSPESNLHIVYMNWL